MNKLLMNKLFVLAVICFAFTAVVLMKTALQRFHEVRKYFRLQEYASEVKDIAESLNTLEKNSLTLKNDVQVLKRIAKHALQYFNESAPPPAQSTLNGLK